MRIPLDRALRWAYIAAAIGWAVALPLAAAAAAAPGAPTREYLFAALAYTVGGIICHQQAGRSFHLWGVQLPVCARCTGIYLGAALGALVFVAFTATAAGGRQRPPGLQDKRDRGAAIARAVLAGAAAPIALTLVFEWTTGITPSNVVRALSGVGLGVAVTWLIVAAGDPRRRVRRPRVAGPAQLDEIH